MGAKKSRLRKVRKIRMLLAIGIELVLKERYKIMGVGCKQRMAVWHDSKTLAIHNSKSQYHVSVTCLEVPLEGDYYLDLRWLAPKPLELVDMRGSPSSLFGKIRKKKFLAFLA
jgi:hypothetical protein